jgi:hypothetical protein
VPEFPGVIRRFIDERGIVSLEEIHGRFIESGRGGITAMTATRASGPSSFT